MPDISKRISEIERRVHGVVESGNIEHRVAKLEAKLEQASETLNRLDTNMVDFQSSMIRQPRHSTPRKHVVHNSPTMSPRDAAVCDPDCIIRKGRGEYRPPERNEISTPNRGHGSPHVPLQIEPDPSPSPHDSCRELRKLRGVHNHIPRYGDVDADPPVSERVRSRSNRALREEIRAGRTSLSNSPRNDKIGELNGFKEFERRKRNHQFSIPREPRVAADTLDLLPDDNQSHKLLQMAKHKGHTPYIPNSPDASSADGIPSYVKKVVDTLPYGQSPRDFFFISPTPSSPKDGGPVSYSQREFLHQKKRHNTPIRGRFDTQPIDSDRGQGSPASTASFRDFAEQKKRHGTPIRSRSPSHSASVCSPAGLDAYPTSPFPAYSKPSPINISVSGDYISL
eukprot:TRINITY_DN21831_c0_g1_i1.p1 TRINITY_DN21831_c0_g1~~TRINITY_DN21831_c0_g1_i1.p1  ORF type:complete len:396 (+),score=52.31 TRINITY_DN21831_c0_g1_i1:68-1255(+)